MNLKRVIHFVLYAKVQQQRICAIKAVNNVLSSAAVGRPDHLGGAHRTQGWTYIHRCQYYRQIALPHRQCGLTQIDLLVGGLVNGSDGYSLRYSGHQSHMHVD